MLRMLLPIIVLLGISGCTDSTPISVANRSQVLLQSVVVSGSGFTSALGDLEPGSSATAHVSPSGESSLSITFTASGKKVSLHPDTYFEGGGSYSVAVVVTPDLDATADTQLHSY